MADKKNGHTRGPLQPLKSYNFTTKDPSIDLTRTAVQSSKLSYKQIHERSGVSLTTMYGWFKGKTRRPQFCTVAAVLITCGVRNVNLGALKRAGSREAA